MRRHGLAVPVAILCLWLGVPSVQGADELMPFPAQQADVPYPTHEWPEIRSDDPNRATIGAILERAFTGQRPAAFARTKAVLVVSLGRIVAERYADGITKDTRLQSWSMSKSFLHAALGLAIADGKLDPAAPAPVPEWHEAIDQRHAITLRQLAQMTDGLDFREQYDDPTSDAMQMLFGGGRGDVGKAAARSRFAHAPGTVWSYSSGSANILARILRDKIGAHEAYRSFLQTRLFAPLGIASAVAEFDASGTWIGSSYVHATARDFARLGLLYLRGGVWDGKQLVPRDWLEVGRNATLASKGRYGALFWLNARDPDTGAPAFSADLPDDMFMARGFGGQLIAIIPSRDAIIVILNADYTNENKPVAALMADILKALPKLPPRRPDPPHEER